MSPAPSEHFAKQPGAATPPDRQAAQAAPTRWPRRVLSWICGIILMVMMALTVIDVIGRYVFNNPLTGATELTELLLVSVIFIGLPAVCLDDEHVTVDLFTSLMPDWIHPWRKALLSVVVAVVLGVVAWRLWVYAGQIAGYNGVTNSLRLPVAPVAQLCAACTAVSVPVTLFVAARDLARALRRTPLS